MDFLWSPWRSHYVGATQKPAGCVFCGFAQNAGTPSAQTAFDQQHHILFRGLHNFLVLNLFPYTSAHLMIVPYAHIADLSAADKSVTDEMMDLAKRAQAVIATVYHPDGFNLGMNLGTAAGAGIAAHMHMHLLPRWSGDANFMTTVGETRVLPEDLSDTYRKLKPYFE